MYFPRALCEELRRYVEDYGWSYSLISHLFSLKHGVNMSASELENVYARWHAAHSEQNSNIS